MMRRSLNSAITRRRVLAGSALAALLAPQAGAARRHAVADCAGSLIDTMTLVSTGGSVVAANTPSPPMFGLQFKKGDIPPGEYPQLQAASGTPWPVTFVNIRSWSDGSMKCCGVLPGPFPQPITPTGVTANVLNGGRAPAASGLDAALLYAEQIKCNVNGFPGEQGAAFGLAGNWSALLANDANLVEIISYGDGGGGRVYRILTHVHQEGAAHGQLECYWYVQQLLNAKGVLAGYRVLPRICQPWYNHDTPAKAWRGIQTFNIQHGSRQTTITPPFNYAPATIAWSAGTAFTGPPPTTWWNGAGAHFGGTGIVYGYLTTTGTLPAGWRSNTIYTVTVSVLGSPTYQMPIPATSSGTGRHTFHPIQSVAHFGSLWGANSAGKYTYIQGAGSAPSDAPIRIIFNNAYRRLTGAMPPIDASLSPAPDPCKTALNGYTYSWDTQSIGPLFYRIGAPGERDDIGLLNAWQVRHFHNQTAVDDIYVRSMGLAAANFCNCLRDKTTRMPVNLDDPGNSYSGMPESQTSTLIWDTQYGYADGFTGPTKVVGSTGSQFFDTNEPHHQPETAGYAYLVTGEPQYLDLITELACAMPAAGWTPSSSLRALPLRTVTLKGRTYYGCLTYQSDNGMRKMGWGLRSLVFASGIYPDADPYSTQIARLLDSLRDTSTRFPNLWIANSNAYLSSIGLWVMNSSGGINSWMYNYYGYVNCLAVGLCEDANAVEFLDNMIKYYNHIGKKHSYWLLHDYYLIAYANGIFAAYPPTPDGGAISNDEMYFAFPDPGSGQIMGFDWTPGKSPAFNWTFGASIAYCGFTPANGDAIIWPLLDPNNPNKSLPGGFSPGTPYYAVNVSGDKFNLAATPGGAPIAPTGSPGSAKYEAWGMRPAKFASTGFLSSYPSPDGYISNFRGVLKYAVFLGIGDTAAVDADTDTRFNGMLIRLGQPIGNFYKANPKYAMSSASNRKPAAGPAATPHR